MMFFYFITLMFFVLNLTIVNSAVVNNSTTSEVPTNSSSILSNDCINNFKLEHLNHALKQIDGAVQNLEEKAHNWAIFRHHIDAWNEQIKSLEHKLDLVKRTQDEQQVFGSKLISLEFTLNHILSKVVYLSDTCNAHQTGVITTATASIRPPAILNTHSNTNDNDNGPDTVQPHLQQQQEQQQHQSRDTNELLYEHIALLGDLKQAIAVDKNLRSELSTRLSNILRHVQNIERDNCRWERRHTLSNGNNKMAKLMAPMSANCNTNQNIERTLKSLDHQVLALNARASIPKDLKQLPTLTKKNSQQLDNIMNWIKKINERLLQWSDENEHGWHQCQTMSGELSTFTESSDLLLKRIEMLVNDVNEKLAKQTVFKSSDKHEEEDEDSMEGEKEVGEIDGHRSADIDNKKTVNGVEGEGDARNVEENMDTPTAIDEAPKIDDHFSQPDKTACHELSGPSVDGVYKFSTPEVNDVGRNFNERYCAFATEGAAWTVIQNRGPYLEHENFNRSWVDYKNGFGELTKEFWFGNEFIHQLVDLDDYELRIELTDFNNEHVWAEYSFFRLDSEQYNYNLLIGGYSGTAPDAMHYHNEMDFSTYDRRNDKSVDACCACATGYGSGWWFDNCSEANLNGIYRETPNGHNYVGIIWEQWRGDYSLPKVRMLIRPKNLSTKEQQAKSNERHQHNEDP